MDHVLGVRNHLENLVSKQHLLSQHNISHQPVTFPWSPGCRRPKLKMLTVTGRSITVLHCVKGTKDGPQIPISYTL